MGNEYVTLTSEQFKNKWLVIFFYFKNLPHEQNILEFQTMYHKFQEAGISVIGCSRDTKFSHEYLIRKQEKPIAFPLVGDVKGDMCRQFGVERDRDSKELPTSFIVSPDGKIIKRIDSISASFIFQEASASIASRA